MYELRRCALPIKVMEIPSYYLLQYGNEPIILIGKQTGRLYGFSDCLKKDNEKQASFVLRILHSFDLVEDKHSTRVVKP